MDKITGVKLMRKKGLVVTVQVTGKLELGTATAERMDPGQTKKHWYDGEISLTVILTPLGLSQTKSIPVFTLGQQTAFETIISISVLKLTGAVGGVEEPYKASQSA
jgi:hypothetical protein